ncbi:MAG: ATP-grasp domain-containing protein [Patescibacteria group bacterium]
MKKILVLSGLKKTTEKFSNLESVTTETFKNLWYISENDTISCFIGDEPLESFDVVYFRVVGPYREHAAVITMYCKQHGIRLIDAIYEQSEATLVPIYKGIETLLHVKHRIRIPKTAFCTPKTMRKVIDTHFSLPVVIKDTEGIKGRNIFSPKNNDELDEVMRAIEKQEKYFAKRFLIQEFITASHRERLFVVGDEVIAGIMRPMRWRKRFIAEGDTRHSGIKKPLTDIADHKKALAVNAAKAVGLDIAGIDLIEDDETKECYIMEANAEPEWRSLSADTNTNVEENIIEYIQKNSG